VDGSIEAVSLEEIVSLGDRHVVNFGWLTP